MLDKWTRQNYNNRESLFISKVIEKIEHGEYMNKTQEWIHCPSGEEIIEGIPICPLHWSNIIGTLNCETGFIKYLSMHVLITKIFSLGWN